MWKKWTQIQGDESLNCENEEKKRKKKKKKKNKKENALFCDKDIFQAGF